MRGVRSGRSRVFTVERAAVQRWGVILYRGFTAGERRERVNHDDARACARDTEACSENIWGLQTRQNAAAAASGAQVRDDGQTRTCART